MSKYKTFVVEYVVIPKGLELRDIPKDEQGLYKVKTIRINIKNHRPAKTVTAIKKKLQGYAPSNTLKAVLLNIVKSY